MARHSGARKPPASHVVWFDGAGAAWAYVGSLVVLVLAVTGAVAADLRGRDDWATLFVLVAALTTWVPGNLAQEHAKWDFFLGNLWPMVRYQTWLQVGLAVPQAVRVIADSAKGDGSDGD